MFFERTSRTDNDYKIPKDPAAGLWKRQNEDKAAV